MTSSLLKIVVVEPLCRGLEHVPFNAGFIEILNQAFPLSKIVFLGSDCHVECMKKAVPRSVLDNVEFESILLPPRHLKSFFERVWLERTLFSRVTDLLQQQKSMVVFLSAPSSSIANSYWRLPSTETLPIHFVMHGGLSKLKNWSGRNPFRRLLDDRFLVTRMSGRNFRYILLEHTIQKELEKIDKHLADKSFVSEHPLPQVPIAESIEMSSERPIRIGFLGTASIQKGFPEFCWLAREMNGRNPGQFEFHAVGSVPSAQAETLPDMSGLSTLPTKEKIASDEYALRIHQIDLVAMPYQSTHYTSSPSGVLLDAIAFGKPVIAKPYPAIVDLFERYGSFGILSDVDGWQERLQEFRARNDFSLYREWKNCLAKVSQSRSIERLAEEYKRHTSKQLGDL